MDKAKLFCAQCCTHKAKPFYPLNRPLRGLKGCFWAAQLNTCAEAETNYQKPWQEVKSHGYFGSHNRANQPDSSNRRSLQEVAEQQNHKKGQKQKRCSGSRAVFGRGAPNAQNPRVRTLPPGQKPEIRGGWGFLARPTLQPNSSQLPAKNRHTPPARSKLCNTCIATMEVQSWAPPFPYACRKT